jgi:hypothetical protein
MKISVVDQARERLAAVYPGRPIGEGKILSADPHPLIQFTVGEEVVTVRHVPPEVTRRAMRAIRADMKRRRGPRVDVVKLLQTERNRRG